MFPLYAKTTQNKDIFHHMKIKKGVLHLFSIQNIFYDKTDIRLFYFHVTIYGFFYSLNIKENVSEIEIYKEIGELP